MGVIVNMNGLEEALIAKIKEIAEKGLSVAPEVSQMVRNRAVVNNEDADGTKMPKKQPRPKHAPKNNPELPLVETGNLMSPDRWTIHRSGDFEVTISYAPPDYHEYLISKPSDCGGRCWLTIDKLNPKVRLAIQKMMIAKMCE